MKINFKDLKLGYDVLIVGMGTAGLMAAKSLSKNLKVLIIDYLNMPRHKTCSGIIVSHGHEILIELNPPEKIYTTPKLLDIIYLDWDNDKEILSKKQFLNTNRQIFDEWLYREVCNLKNVHVCDCTRLIDFYLTKDKKFVVSALKFNETNVTSIIANYVIGADGAVSTVRDKLFGKQIPFYVAMQELVKCDKNIEKAYFIFDSEITDHYGWVIPKGEKIEIGVALNPQSSMDNFNIFKSHVKKKLGVFGHGKIESAIFLRPKNKSDICLGKGNILIVGEAASLITPSSAEGISNALRSARYAAEVINKHPNNPLYDYTRKCATIMKRLEKKFEKSKILKDPSKRAVKY